MKDTDAECFIDGVHIVEINIQHSVNHSPSMNAVYALVATKERKGSHGRCEATTNAWSKRTTKILEELIESMESDLITRHFNVDDELEKDIARTEFREIEETPQI